MIFFLDTATLPITSRKSSVGATREIIAIPSTGAPFLRRTNIAALQADGSFSPFPGVDRAVILLAGQPLRLCGGDIDHPLTLQQPWVFPGEQALPSVGIVESGLDFNIMIQCGHALARVKMINDQQRPAIEGIAYVLQGEWDLAGQRSAAGGGLCWRDGSPGEL